MSIRFAFKILPSRLSGGVGVGERVRDKFGVRIPMGSGRVFPRY